MWFINFVLGSAAAVTLLVLGASAYFDRASPSDTQLSGIADVVPLPRAAPKAPRPQPAVVEDGPVREPNPGKAIKVRHRRQDNGRRATW